MNETLEFQNFLARNGVIGYSYSDAEYLLNVAKLCAKTSGIPLAGVGGVALAGAGSIAIPGVGAVPGWIVGALAGFVGGTTACVIARAGMKPALDQILHGR